MHIHTDIAAFLFVGVAWLLWKNILPMAAALGVQYHVPGANTIGKLAA